MSIHPEANYLEYVLRTQNLTKQFGEKTAVKNVSMQIKKGEIYGFIGKNGAGKTTLMRLVLGAAMPTTPPISSAGTAAQYAALSASGSSSPVPTAKICAPQATPAAQARAR